jgi:hypothetical protein
MKGNPFVLKTQVVPRCKHSPTRYKDQSVNAVRGKIAAILSDPYKKTGMYV